MIISFSTCRCRSPCPFSYLHNFPLAGQLMEILNLEQHADIITWLPHGKAFIIYKKKKFAAEVLPVYFKQSKFTSFTRKLNRWGFTRVTRGPETGAYYHKFFQRDDSRLCMQMSCQNVKLQSDQQIAFEQQQHALAASAGAIHPLFLQQSAPSPSIFTQPFPGTSMAALSSTLMQQQLQQLQIEQLQKQQQEQAAELVRRAMATQATAAATRAQLATFANPGAGPAGTPGLVGGGFGGANDSDALYSHMLAQSKASSMSAQPLMTAIQNSLRESGEGGGLADTTKEAHRPLGVSNGNGNVVAAAGGHIANGGAGGAPVVGGDGEGTACDSSAQPTSSSSIRRASAA